MASGDPFSDVRVNRSFPEETSAKVGFDDAVAYVRAAPAPVDSRANRTGRRAKGSQLTLDNVMADLERRWVVLRRSGATGTVALASTTSG